MANDVVISQNDMYAARIFFYSALPLIKVIAEKEPKYGNKFKGKNFVFQVSACYDKAEGGKLATHFIIDDNNWTTKVGKIHEKPDVEFVFSDVKKFVLFFTGRSKALPKIKGFFKFGKLIPILGTLLRMAGLLQASEAPESEEDKQMMVLLYFYLLSNGISQLNKMGHPEVKAFTKPSPDRAYAFEVTGYPDLKAWIRIKAGNSKAGRGAYKRCKPFLTMKFDTLEHALDILMSKGDMIEYIQNQWLVIDGAPEFGGVLGNQMMTVGYYALGQYLDD